jgi:UDP-glucuronate decarboxylase
VTRTALVTGAAGFVASHLVDRLLRDGWTVVGVDNLSTGRRPNLTEARRHDEFRFLKRDVRRPGSLPNAELIFHLASPASPPAYLKSPIYTLETNALGTLAVLRHAATCGARVVVGSTSEVYGDPEVHPQTESYWGRVNPIGPRSCYDEGKRFGEALAAAWHRERQLDVRLARIFNTFGPRMALDDGRVVTNFLVQGWSGAPITVQGEGTQSRAFCYVDDLVDGLARLASVPSVDGPVNLGNPEGEMTILELAQRVRSLTGYRSEIVHIARGVDDPERRRPDISKARTVLGWAPTTPFPVGLQSTSDWVRSELGMPAEDV